jgi:excisionase family DNA binding protein
MAAMLTVSQVAVRIGCKNQAVRRLMSEGRLPGAKLAGQWRVDADVLERWLARVQAPDQQPSTTVLALPSEAGNPFA